MSSVPNAVTSESRREQAYIDERPIWPDGTRLPSIPIPILMATIRTRLLLYGLVLPHSLGQ